jgi:hypothetical protein
MGRFVDTDRFKHSAELVRNWMRVKHGLDAADLNAVDQELLTLAVEAGTMVWILDCQQLKGPLPGELAEAYQDAVRDYTAAISYFGFELAPVGVN